MANVTTAESSMAFPLGILAPSAPTELAAKALATLRGALGCPLQLVDVESGTQLLSDPDTLGVDLSGRLAVLETVSRRGRPELIEDEPPLAVLAVPLQRAGLSEGLVAIGVFVSQPVTDPGDLLSAARVLGVDADRAWQWARDRETFPLRAAQRLAELALDNLANSLRLSHAEAEAFDATSHARDSNVALGLIHRLTNRLLIAERSPQFWDLVLEWLAEAIPAEAMAIVSQEAVAPQRSLDVPSDLPGVLVRGRCQADAEDLVRLARILGSRPRNRPVVCNRSETSSPGWVCSAVREVVCAPISQGSMVVGWLLAVNHRGDSRREFTEFGSVEARLMHSVGAILGVHTSNKRLFQRQSDLFSSSVRRSRRRSTPKTVTLRATVIVSLASPFAWLVRSTSTAGRSAQSTSAVCCTTSARSGSMTRSSINRDD